MATLQSIIGRYNRVTTNQAALFDRLLIKYARQLQKHQVDANMLHELTWKTPVVESTSDYTGARVSFNEQHLTIKVPFNKQFITFFGTKINHNPFIWNKDEKIYTASFSTYALKIAYNTLPRFFKTVQYCSNTQPIITSIENYSAKFWNPTMTLVDNRPVIMAINQALADQIDSTIITTDPECISQLVNLGVEIDPIIYQGDQLRTLAASKLFEIDINDLELTIKTLAALKFETIAISRIMPSCLNRQSIVDMIIQHGMNAVDMRIGEKFEGRTASLQHTSVYNLAVDGKIEKIIAMKNSQPIGL